ncbi:hypothetical protein PTSG_04586 [Salpingoeca rosetta]|uniref:pantothenate kinase n=1 Tax=Salpingoeca rosetta (strain ATCC 50818 / BSB-021) TaxID=946362 RepID=F2U7V3_SALR5|nr:uncharacterized protein PTSG_04586 [Salpingoeca rosetta]EGD72858.1 hypothetical protein PTSG_04586 [Salpingoeca rosetta]|eukprot:XP_004994681.1 hypothetical protein PTSG_04586 [Salpingoeca rosetta]
MDHHQQPQPQQQQQQQREAQSEHSGNSAPPQQQEQQEQQEQPAQRVHTPRASVTDMHTKRSFACGIDIGGTLCKICYFEPFEQEDDPEDWREFRRKAQALIQDELTYGETGRRDTHLEFESIRLGGRILFMRFETRKMDDFLEAIRSMHLLEDHEHILCCTGGGARKYKKPIYDLFHIELPHTDELECLVDGINFVLHHPSPQLFQVSHEQMCPDGTAVRSYLSLDEQKSIFPYLLVNIGSGVSILKVNEDGQNERVGGSSLGGATFFGLASLLTGCKSFDEALALAGEGEASGVDLLVGDIYGGDYEEYGLSADIVAASLGKLVRPKDREHARPCDLARGLLDAITNNVGQLALLHAQTHDVCHVVFAGNFLRSNCISMMRLSYALEFWSKGVQRALFLKHEGYFGAVGAMLHILRDDTHGECS